MKTKADWEARARDLCHLGNEGGGLSLSEAMLQLGREMADARAEEIARHAEELQAALSDSGDYWDGYRAALLGRPHEPGEWNRRWK